MMNKETNTEITTYPQTYQQLVNKLLFLWLQFTQVINSLIL